MEKKCGLSEEQVFVLLHNGGVTPASPDQPPLTFSPLPTREAVSLPSARAP